MFGFGKPKTLPAEADALPGRAQAVPIAERHLINGANVKPPYPPGSEIAEFALGCFWGEEKLFWEQPGVIVTAVGYEGGFTPNPTYEEVCSGKTGHAETVRVVFDPTRITYEQLLKLFWEAHNPTQGMRQGNDVGTQYRSAIFTHSDSQAAAANASREMYQRELTQGGLRRDPDRDPPGAGVLLRRGLPPAVPRQGPERLLPGARDRREARRTHRDHGAGLSVAGRRHGRQWQAWTGGRR